MYKKMEYNERNGREVMKGFHVEEMQERPGVG